MIVKTSVFIILMGISMLLSSCERTVLDSDMGSAETPLTKFSHPGCLFNNADLERIKAQVRSGKQPWASAYSYFKGITDETLDKEIIAYNIVYRGDPPFTDSWFAFSRDSEIAYHCALMWNITGDEKYAKKSIEILNAWTKTQTKFTSEDAMLVVSWCGFFYVNAAEIMRYTYPKWSQADIKQAEEYFINVLYPVIEPFFWGRSHNWTTSIIKSMIAFGIFTERTDIFYRGYDALKGVNNGGQGGSITNYIYDTGQAYESARDQVHAQMGIAGLVQASEVLLKQNIDMYGFANNRLLLGVEYTAKYNLGYDDIPTPFYSNGHGSVISNVSRGTLHFYYEMVYNHYKWRKGLTENSLKYTKAAFDKNREGLPTEFGNPAMTGYGTLLHNEAPYK